MLCCRKIQSALDKIYSVQLACSVWDFFFLPKYCHDCMDTCYSRAHYRTCLCLVALGTTQHTRPMMLGLWKWRVCNGHFLIWMPVRDVATPTLFCDKWQSMSAPFMFEFVYTITFGGYLFVVTYNTHTHTHRTVAINLWQLTSFLDWKQ